MSERICQVVVVLLVGVGLPVGLAYTVGAVFPSLAGEARGAGAVLGAVMGYASLYSLWEG